MKISYNLTENGKKSYVYENWKCDSNRVRENALQNNGIEFAIEKEKKIEPSCKWVVKPRNKRNRCYALENLRPCSLNWIEERRKSDQD